MATKLTLAQLERKRAEIDTLIQTKQDETRVELKNEINDLLSKNGFAIEDIFPKITKARRSGATVAAAKYRNPADISETWTGRGRPPKWALASAKNGSYEHMLIVKK